MNVHSILPDHSFFMFVCIYKKNRGNVYLCVGCAHTTICMPMLTFLTSHPRDEFSAEAIPQV